MRRALALLPLLIGALVAGSAPAAVGPPRLLGLSISNGGHPFLGDTRQLATVSPNGDGLRDRALVRFHLDRAASVELQVVATSSFGRPPTVVWRIRRSLAPGPRALTWKPKRATPDRTYLLRFVVKVDQRDTTHVGNRYLGGMTSVPGAYAYCTTIAPMSIVTYVKKYRETC